MRVQRSMRGSLVGGDLIVGHVQAHSGDTVHMPAQSGYGMAASSSQIWKLGYDLQHRGRQWRNSACFVREGTG